MMTPRQTPTYRSWNSMKDRCLNPKSSSWGHYGGRGITVCDRWRNSFADFLADMGERPAGTTLDRIEGQGNYEPGNCRWATKSEQMKNRDMDWLRAPEPQRERARKRWAEHTKDEPWKAMNLSRATYFRRKKAGTL